MTRPRVLVARPWAEGRALAARLERLGFAPVLAPVVAIEALPVVLPPEPIDAILATSAHAATGLSARDREAIGQTPVYAVGAATAAALRRAGFADVRVAGGNAEALVSLVRLTHPGPARLLYLCGRVRKPVLAQALEADGHALTIRESYEATALAWPPEAAAGLRESPPAACLHFSRRSAALVVAEAGRAGLDEALGRAAQLCLSAEVATALRPWASGRIVVPARSTTDSLLQALAVTVAPAA